MADKTAAASTDKPSAGGETAANSKLSMNGLSAVKSEELTQLALAAATRPASVATEGMLASATNTQLAPVGQSADLALVSAALAGSLSSAAATGVSAGTDNTLNALLLSGGLGTLGNFGSAAAISGLLGDMTAAQVAGLTQGAAGGLGNLGLGLLGQGAVAAADDEADGKNGQSGNKQLSSRYRGVCWNKKNKRWQAAINSGGKYIYLGSFTSEDDAARQFDRAAIKIRGKKAKLNFAYADYVDVDGNLLEDLVLPTGTTAKDEKPSTGRNSSGGRPSKGDFGADGTCLYYEATPGADLSNQALLASLQAGNGAAWAVDPSLPGLAAAPKVGRVAAVLNVNDVRAFIPKGCSVEAMLPGPDGCMFGVIHKSESGQLGCGLWTGYKFCSFGDCQNEQDMRQMLTKSMDMLYDDRQIRATQPTAAAAAGGVGSLSSIMAGKADDTAADDTNAQLMAVLGLGGGYRPAVLGGTSAAAGGLFNLVGGDSSKIGVGIGDLANLDISKARQLASQAAEQQGVSMGMSYPPLSLGLPGSRLGGQQQQQQDASGASGASLQYIQQILQQTGAQQQQQQMPAGTSVLSKLSDLDVATLAQLIKQQDSSQQQQQQPQPQQQQQQQQSEHPPASSTPIGGAISGMSLEELLAGIGAKPAAAAAAPAAPATVAAAASSAPSWSELLGIGSSKAMLPAAAAGGTSSAADAAFAAEEPAAKRLRLSETGPAAPADATAAVAGADGSKAGAAAADHAAQLQNALQQVIALGGSTAS